MNLPLFDSTPVLTPRQRVNVARDEALARVKEHAEQRRQRFTADAQAFVVRYLEQHGPTSGEALTLACKAAGLVPHDDRAYGPVYLGLCRRGVIEKVGECRRERGHGTGGGRIWQLRK